MKRFRQLSAAIFLAAVLLAAPLISEAKSVPAQKPKKKAPRAEQPPPDNAPPAVKLEVARIDAGPGEKDPLREAWRIPVDPYAVLGSGRPGKTASDIDKPDGLAFVPDGALLATDAKNHRIIVWDVKSRARLGEFGHGIFGGEIVDLAVAPNGAVFVTDQILNLAYAFAPPEPGAKDEKGRPLGKYDLQFKGTRFGEQIFDKLGGIATDSGGRIYTVDAHLNDVRRFLPDGKTDPDWKFEKGPAGTSETYLHGCEGIAIDETAGNLFVASEKDSIIQVFDSQTGAYKGKLIGSGSDGIGKPNGTSIFSGSVEGLALFGHYLLAVDESVGHVQIFDLSRTTVFNSDLLSQSGSLQARDSGYLGFFGHSPQVDFEDKTNKTLQQQVKDGAIIPGQANPPGYFCSPDSIAAFTDKESGETWIAVADQCNYRLAVYKWSEIENAIKAATKAITPEPALEAPVKNSKKKKKKS